MNEFYNHYLSRIIKVESGDELCKKCLGKGIVRFPLAPATGNTKSYTNLRCSECNGKGKKDWVEKIVGVKST